MTELNLEDITLKQLLHEILINRKEITKSNVTLAHIVTNLETCLNELKSIKIDQETMKEKINKQEEEIKYLKTRERRNNLVIYNITEECDENVLEKVKEVVEIALEDSFIDQC
jgi:uncharacterized protein with gpF-like domain